MKMNMNLSTERTIDANNSEKRLMIPAQVGKCDKNVRKIFK
jgi:hypothetical protein